MFGVQWDAVCVFIEHYDKNNTATTKSDWLKKDDYGKLWGNYSKSKFKLDRGYYTTSYSSKSVTWTEGYATEKETSTECFYTTGASEQNKSLNIYDFGGNGSEWTLEQEMSSTDGEVCVYRCGGSRSYGSAFDRVNLEVWYCDFDLSSRSALYIK